MIYCTISGYLDGPPDSKLIKLGLTPLVSPDRQFYSNTDQPVWTVDLVGWAAYVRTIPPGVKVVIDIEIRADRAKVGGYFPLIRLNQVPAGTGYGADNNPTGEIDEDCAWIREIIAVFRANSSNELYMYQPIYCSYWAANTGTAGDKTAIRASNDYLKTRLINYLDGIVVSLYSPYKNIPGGFNHNELPNWKKWCDFSVAEAVRVGAGKKVMAFIWPRYADGSHDTHTKEQFAYQMECVRNAGAECAIWEYPYYLERGLPKLNFDFTAGWWRATVDASFRAGAGYSCSRVGQIEGQGNDALLTSRTGR